MKLLILVLLSSITWILAVVNWFQHDDHTALGWFGASMILGNWANNEARAFMERRRMTL